jgi:hypothetical protein
MKNFFKLLSNTIFTPSMKQIRRGGFLPMQNLWIQRYEKLQYS